MIKVPKELGIEGIFLSIIKAVYGSPIVNIILKGEEPRAHPLKYERRQDCFLLLFNIMFQVLARVRRQRKNK